MAITVLYYSPGQKATIFLETLNGVGQRTDSPSNPVVTRVIFPDLSLACGFPQDLVKLDTGLYFFQFVAPINGNSIGSYLVDVAYSQPETDILLQSLYQLVITAPFGVYSAATR